MQPLNFQDVLRYLPQRYPFIFIDKVIAYEKGERLTAVKNVSGNEPYFAGHFPGQPVMPGVLILEALAQASIILANLSFDVTPDNNGMHLFAGIDNARFKQIVTPGDQLQLEVALLRKKHSIWKMHGEATVDGKLVCCADLMSVTKDLESDR